MGVMTRVIGQKKYARLLSKALPKAIETDDEFNRLAALLEELEIPERELSPEREALAGLIEKLISDYDDVHYSIPEGKPHEIVRFLMQQRGLKPADLVPVIGTRAQVSDLVNEKRAIGTSQAKKLAGFFHIPAELFI